jgi:hypothetical protein
MHNFQKHLGTAIIAEHSFWLYRSTKKINSAHLLKASIQRYKKLDIATSVALSIDQAFGPHASPPSDMFSDDYYHFTSIQLLKITLDNLIST